MTGPPHARSIRSAKTAVHSLKMGWEVPMKHCIRVFLGVVSLILLTPRLHSQAAPAGIFRSHIQAGAGVMYLYNDYSDRAVYGLSVWGDYDFTHLLGVEFEAHFGGLETPDDIGENSYLVGPRLMYHRKRFTGYAKLMIGRATITNQNYNQSSSYNVLPAYGAGLEYRVSHKLNVRVVDFESQRWPDFEPNSLTPLTISVGLMYVIR